MPKLLLRDRRLVVRDRKLLTDEGGAPCCCGGGGFPLFPRGCCPLFNPPSSGCELWGNTLPSGQKAFTMQGSVAVTELYYENTTTGALIQLVDPPYAHSFNATLVEVNAINCGRYLSSPVDGLLATFPATMGLTELRHQTQIRFFIEPPDGFREPYVGLNQRTAISAGSTTHDGGLVEWTTFIYLDGPAVQRKYLATFLGFMETKGGVRGSIIHAVRGGGLSSVQRFGGTARVGFANGTSTNSCMFNVQNIGGRYLYERFFEPGHPENENVIVEGFLELDWLRHVAECLPGGEPAAGPPLSRRRQSGTDCPRCTALLGPTGRCPVCGFCDGCG